MIEVVVFDFDGVLVDSNAVKRDAYFEIFAHRGEAVRGVIERALVEEGDGDRFETIGVILRRLGGEEAVLPVREGAIARYAERYNDLCEEHAATCREVPGASGALDELSRVLPLYVNSATPEEPLRRIVRRRGWEPHFRAVLGRPLTKEENLRRIFLETGVSPRRALFVGDGKRDVAAARELGCPFLAVRNAFNDFDLSGLPAVDNLDDLPTVVRNWRV